MRGKHDVTRRAVSILLSVTMAWSVPIQARAENNEPTIGRNESAEAFTTEEVPNDTNNDLTPEPIGADEDESTTTGDSPIVQTTNENSGSAPESETKQDDEQAPADESASAHDQQQTQEQVGNVPSIQNTLEKTVEDAATKLRETDESEEQKDDTTLVTNLYRMLAAVSIEAPHTEQTDETAPDVPNGESNATGGAADKTALAALNGERSTAASVTHAFALVARELGIEAQELVGADGSTWAIVRLGDMWRHTDPAAATDSEDETWLLLTDEQLLSAVPQRAPWTLVDGTEAPVCIATPSEETSLAQEPAVESPAESPEGGPEASPKEATEATEEATEAAAPDETNPKDDVPVEKERAAQQAKNKGLTARSEKNGTTAKTNGLSAQSESYIPFHIGDTRTDWIVGTYQNRNVYQISLSKPVHVRFDFRLPEQDHRSFNISLYAIYTNQNNGLQNSRKVDYTYTTTNDGPTCSMERCLSPGTYELEVYSSRNSSNTYWYTISSSGEELSSSFNHDYGTLVSQGSYYPVGKDKLIKLNTTYRNVKTANMPTSVYYRVKLPKAGEYKLSVNTTCFVRSNSGYLDVGLGYGSGARDNFYSERLYGGTQAKNIKITVPKDRDGEYSFWINSCGSCGSCDALWEGYYSFKISTTESTRLSNNFTASGNSTTLSKFLVDRGQAKAGTCAKVSNAKGAVTYTRVLSTDSDKRAWGRFGINTSTGAVIAHKGIPTGTYKLRVNVKDPGNSTYASAWTTVTFTVKVSNKTEIVSASEVTGYKKRIVFTGKAVRQNLATLVVARLGVKLTRNKDFTVSFEGKNGNSADLVNVGTKYLVLTSKNAKLMFQGSDRKTTKKLKIPYTVTAADIGNVQVVEPGAKTYSGKAITWKPTKAPTFNGYVLKAPGAKSADYTLSNNVHTVVGNYAVTMTGTGNFTGQRTFTQTIDYRVVKILPIDTGRGYWEADPPLEATVEGALKDEPIPSSLYGVERDSGYWTGEYAMRTYGTFDSYGSKVYGSSTYGNYLLVFGTGTFRISQYGMSDVTIDAIPARTYTGSPIRPLPTVRANGTTLIKDVDYTLKYVNNTNAGTATIYVTGAGNYAGYKTATFSIAKCSMTKAAVSGISSRYAYTGNPITPKPTVKVGSAQLKEGTDYTLSYANNRKSGTATVTISAKAGRNVTGSTRRSFTIVQPTMSYRVHAQQYGDMPWVGAGEVAGTSGESKRLEAIWIKLGTSVKKGGIEYNTHVQREGWQPTWSKNGAMSGTSGESKRLEAVRIRLTGNIAQDFDVYYRVHAQSFGWMGWAKNGMDAGTAGFGRRLEAIQICLFPKGSAGPATTYNNVYENETRPFVQQNVTYKSVAGLSVSKVDALVYNGKARTPKPTVKDGSKTLKLNKHYTLSYTNNTNAGTATITIRGMGRYYGTRTVKFAISKAKNPITAKENTKRGKTTTNVATTKKAVTLAGNALVVSKAQGSVTYSKVAGSSKYLTINKKTGKIVVAKGTEVGEHVIKVRATAAGTKNYNKGNSSIVTLKVMVLRYEAEPNDTPDTSDPATPVPLGQYIYGRTDQGYAYDYMRVKVTKNGDYHLQIVDGKKVDKGETLYACLYSPDGNGDLNMLASMDVALGEGMGSSTFMWLTPGTYYIAVYGSVANHPYHARLSVA